MNFGLYKKLTFGIILLTLIGFYSFAETYTIQTVNEFNKIQKLAVSKDSIIWKNGHYQNMNISLEADGVFLVAENSGAVIFSGGSTLKVIGNENIISGFQFQGGKIKGDVVDISGNKNTIQQINIESYDSHYYLRIRPNSQYNSVLYCNFESKPETQESSVVQVEATEGLPGYHVISHCSFKNHTAPPGAGGDFGIEALRIGYSYQRTFISRVIVEYCYFEKCNGDYEIISCKARENIMRYNTFYNNGPAHLTLRHGSRNMVYGNFFLEGAGVRIKEGQNHSIINNYFDTGDQMALQIQNYHFDPVDTVYISNNTFISCSPLQLGGKGEYPPENVFLANNVFSSLVKPVFIEPTNTETWNANIFQSEKELLIDGFSSVLFETSKNGNGLYETDFPEKFLNNFESKKLPVSDIPEIDDDYSIAFDIMKQKRVEESNEVAGCYYVSKNKPLNCFARTNNTGPIYLK